MGAKSCLDAERNEMDLIVRQSRGLNNQTNELEKEVGSSLEVKKEGERVLD